MLSNPVVFWDLPGNDVEKSVCFFRGVFGGQINFEKYFGFSAFLDTVPTDLLQESGISNFRRPKLPFKPLNQQVEYTASNVRIINEKWEDDNRNIDHGLWWFLDMPLKQAIKRYIRYGRTKKEMRTQT